MPIFGGRGNKRGSGSPEGNVTAPAGSVYEQTDTGIAKSWVKKWDVYSNAQTGWYPHMLGPRTDQGIFIRYVANGGSNSNDGLSPGSALATIGAAITSLGSAAGTIYVGDGTYTETVVITTPGLRIVGVGGAGVDTGSARIKAPSPTANCIEVNANHVRLENLTTVSADTTWNGIGLRVGNFSPDFAAAFGHFVNVQHKGSNITTSASNGGTAVKTQNGEGHRFENFYFSTCRIGVHVFTESSECVWSNTRGTAAYSYALLIDGLPVGGHLFLHWKTTHSGSGAGSPGAAPITVDIGPDPAVQSGGQHTFINCDWDEGGYVKARVLCNRNTFIGGATAPGTQMVVDGDNNYFSGVKANGQPWTISGDRNVFDNCYAIDAWAFTGADNVVRNTSGINNATGTFYRELHRDVSNSTYGAGKSGASRSGYPLMRGQSSAPADAEIATGEVVSWFDNTTGTPLLKVKGKDAGGTVFTRTLGRLDQIDAPTASVVLNSQKITGLATPTAGTDAATKAYADSLAAGLDPHGSVRVATTANITLSGTQTIDGIAVVANDRVLVKNQTTTSANGIYVCASGAWSRSTDADTGAELTGGTFTFIESGTVHADQGWVATHNGTPTLDTDPITFSQFSGAGVGYSDEQAQDSVGTILTDTATVDLTYADGTPAITADVKPLAITDAQIATANKDGTAGTPSLRTLGTGATQALPGNTPIGSGVGSMFERTLASSTAVGDTTITVDSAPALTTGSQGYVCIDPFTANCEVRKISGVAGSVLTLQTALSQTATNISFTASTKRIAAASGTTIAQFFPGTKIKVTGSASNNGTYTVAEFPRDDTYTGTFITVVESLVNESAGASVTIKIDLCVAHSSGVRVLWLSEGYVPLALYGVKGDGNTASASANVTGIQRAINDGWYTGHRRFRLPEGVIYVNDEIFLEEAQHLFGADTNYSTVKATTPFGPGGAGFTSGAVAIVHGREHGKPVLFDSGGPSPRTYMYNFQVQGTDIAGANGILISTEQPILCDNIRAQHCPGYGMCITETQQFTGRNLTLSLNGTNLYLRSALFAWFKDLDLEGQNSGTLTTAHVKADKLTGVSDNFSVCFDNVHVEDGGSPAIAFDIRSGVNWRFTGSSIQNNNAASTTFKFAAGAGGAYANPGTTYQIDSWYFISANASLAIDDADRGLSITTASLDRHILNFIAGSPVSSGPTYPDGFPAMFLPGLSGAYLSLGAPKASGAEKAAFIRGKNASVNPGRPMVWRNSSNADMFVVDESGNLALTSAGVRVYAGSGVPESSITAPIGSLYLRTNGAASTTLYVKESGTGNTGWVAQGRQSPVSALTLANGANDNVSIAAGVGFVRITGPTAAFSISGVANPSDGKRLVLYNATAQAMTITNEGAASTAVNRIRTLTSADIAGRSQVELIYEPTTPARWNVLAVNP